MNAQREHQRSTAAGPSLHPLPSPLSPVKVAIAALTKHYRTAAGLVTAIDGLDLQVRAGEVCTVVGPSGCGKSTLLRILAGLEGADGGSARVAQAERRLPAAMVFQGASLFPWLTARDNVAYPLWAAGMGRRE